MKNIAACQFILFCVIANVTYCFAQTNYYSKSTGNLQTLSTWGTNTDGSGTQPVNFTSNNQIFNIRNNATPTISSNWTVSGSGSKIIVGNGSDVCNFTIPAGSTLTTNSPVVIDVSAFAKLTITNATIPTFGILSPTSTVIYNSNADQIISAVNYGNLTIGGSKGILNIIGGSVSFPNSGTIGIAGTLTINVTFGLLLSSNWNITGSTINFNSNDTQIIPSSPSPSTNFKYYNLTASGGTKTTDGDIELNSSGTFTVNSPSIFSPTATQRVTGNTLTGTGTIQVSWTASTADLNAQYPFSTRTINDLTVDYNGAGNQNINNYTYYNLISSGSGTKTPTAGFTVTNDFTINSGATFAAGANTYNIGGNWSNNGTFTKGTSLVTFNTTTTGKTISGTLTGASAFNNLTFNGSGGAWSLSNNAEVSGAFTLTNGSLDILTNTLTLNGNASRTNGSLSTSTTGTVNYNQNTDGQAVLSGNYGNLTFSNFNKTLASSGTIGVSNTFTPGSASSHTITGSTIDFNGAAQNIPAFNFYNLACSGSATKTLTAAASVVNLLTIGSGVTLAAGTDLLTLLSTASQTANVGIIPSNSSITGQVIAERFVTGGNYNPYRSFRMLSSPVNDASGATTWSAAQLIDDIFVTGPGKTLNGFDNSLTSKPSAYTYNEPVKTATGQDYLTIPQVNANVASTNIGQGLMVFYRGDKSNENVMYSATINPASTVVDFVGTLNQQSITRSLSYTNNSETTDGFNLLGNPYQCTIDWNAASGWTKTNISNTIYIYNPALRNYATYNGSIGVNGGSRYIYPGEGFFVQATAPGALVTFTENIKASSIQPDGGDNPLLLSAPVFAQDKSLKLIESTPSTKRPNNSNIMQAPSQSGSSSLTNNMIRARLVKDSFYDETVVVFKDNESNSFTGNDAPHLEGGSIISLTSQSADQTALAINYMNNIENVSLVKLNVNAALSGSYTLNFTDINLPIGYNVQLKDNYLNNITDINISSQYSFSIDTALKSSFGNNRFEILINNPTTLSVELTSFTGKAISQGALLSWKTISEKDNDLFEVERSLDGQTFVKIGSVKSKNSNSSSTTSYEFIDTQPAVGINYYRLKQIDLDGKPTIINPVSVNVNSLISAEAKLTLYPNPTTDKINITFNGLGFKKGILSVTNAAGKMQISKNIGLDDTQSQVSIDVNGLTPGVYFIEIQDTDKKSALTRKFIKR